MNGACVAGRVQCVGVLLCAMVTLSSSALGDPGAFFFTDFDSGIPSEFSGVTTTTGVQGWEGLGHESDVFSGLMLRNDTGPYGEGPALPTRLTLSGLPPHDCIDVHFLLAVIDTWDGNSGGCDPDFFNVTIDGHVVFSESFTNFPDTHTASYPNESTPPGVILAQFVELGFLDFYVDSAYDLGLDPALQSIPHMGSTLTIEWFASGDGWQGSYDESWAIENVEVFVGSPTPIEATTWGRARSLFRGEGD